MQKVLQSLCLVFALAAAGCNFGGSTISFGFGPSLAPIVPGEQAEAHITVRFSDDSGPWSGRRVKVSIRHPADVAVEPPETEVTLDANGRAVVRVYVVPDKAATSGPRTLVITAIGADSAKSTLNVEIAVR
jgi:hypothetical protein